MMAKNLSEEILECLRYAGGARRWLRLAHSYDLRNSSNALASPSLIARSRSKPARVSHA
jgi:hypothetical protein